MYPSYNNCNFNSIPFFSDNDNDINSISKDDHSFGFPNSPSMRYEYEAASHQFHDVFYDQHNSLATDVPAQINVAYSCKAAAKDLLKEVCYSKTSQQISRKRSSNKDRHSKINTAHGPRDRRMRLSLDVAHKFFGLQDMLGFDKASKTVDWLLRNSRSAIRELMQGPCIYKQTCSLSSTSECEVVSGIDDQSAIYENKSTKKSELDKPSSAKEKKKKSKVARTTVAKESRRKARERARARTSEKNSLRESEPKTANNHCSTRFRTCQLETGEESVNRSSNMNPSYEILAEVEQLSSRGVQILGATDEDNWNASTILNYQPGAANSSHEPQFTDFVFCYQTMGSLQQFNLSG